MVSPSDALQLIVGLGNKGSEYERTRHNAGFWFCQALAATHQKSWKKQDKFYGVMAEITLEGRRCRMLCPHTYVNNSGQAVQAVCQFYKILPQHILVVHDELDFLPGQLRLKQGGGVGGHNGLKSIVQSMGTDVFLRFRLGIGQPQFTTLTKRRYVLSAPEQGEYTSIQQAIQQGIDVLSDVMKGDLQRVFRILHASI